MGRKFYGACKRSHGTPPYVNSVLHTGMEYKYKWGKCLQVFYVYVDTTCEFVRWNEEKD